MELRIHKRLPVEFVKEVLQSFNTYRISEKEGMTLLSIGRSRLHQLRRRWLLTNRRKPFRLCSRTRNAFHLLSPSRPRGNFINPSAAIVFASMPYVRGIIMPYLMRRGRSRFETSGPGALFQHDSSYHFWLPSTRNKHYPILTKDDHSRTIVGARIVPNETSFDHLEVVRETLITYGLPLVYYLDNHSIFRFVLYRGVHVRYKLREDEGEIQFRRALQHLDIGMIYTGRRQAQAKGKIKGKDHWDVWLFLISKQRQRGELVGGGSLRIIR